MLSFVGSQLTSQLDDMTTKVTDGHRPDPALAQHDLRHHGHPGRGLHRPGPEWLSSGNLTDTATAAGLTATHIVAGFFLAMFSLFFFLYDGPVIWGWVVRLFPRGARERVHSSGLIAWTSSPRSPAPRSSSPPWTPPASASGAAILGVPFASGIALLVFFGAFIPVVGAAISGTVAVLLALVALGPVQALIMLGIVIGVQQIESHLLQPLLVGRVMRIHPLAVILAIAAGIVLAGIIGGLIAVPTVAVLNAVGHHLLDGPEAEDGAPGAAQTADEVLGPDEEAGPRRRPRTSRASRAGVSTSGRRRGRPDRSPRQTAPPARQLEPGQAPATPDAGSYAVPRRRCRAPPERGRA